MALKVVDLPAETAPTEDDFLMIRDNATGTTRKIAISVFLDTFTYRFVPTGSLLAFGTTSAPTGFLVCDGSPIDRTTYAGLFAVIGTNFGPGNGVDTFNLPDLRGKVVVGLAASGTFNQINNTGGEETHLIIGAEMPNHNHTGTTNTVGNHAHGYLAPIAPITVKAINPADTALGHVPTRTGAGTDGAGAHNHVFLTDTNGGSQPHNNLQPYKVLNYIIKI